MAATIEQLFQEWQATRPGAGNGNHRPDLVKEARLLLQDPKRCGVSWPLNALSTVGTPEQTLEDKGRVSFLLQCWHWQRGPIPKRLLEPLLRAGVYEPNASYNRWYIEPCMRCFGSERVIARLIEYLEKGTNQEKVGANNAFYWAIGLSSRYAAAAASTDAANATESLKSLRQRLTEARLREFVNNPDVEVRRSLIRTLDLTRQAYPPDLRPVLQEAEQIIRTHPDERIRNRNGWKRQYGGPE